MSNGSMNTGRVSADAQQTGSNSLGLKRPSRSAKLFSRISKVITRATGRPATSIVALCVILVWALSGPIFDYSNTWQLVINTGTTIVTFLMVFIIQQSQNKDTLALQLKLNELIACQKNASNRLIDIEDLTEDELEVLKKFYIKLSNLAEKENDLFSSHSIEDATEIHNQKKRKKPLVKFNGE
ncbi:MAG: low affinity iron permease family protein [Marivirga sp.]|nr:low affinity iron permease family protein [Marivirga sp.]